MGIVILVKPGKSNDCDNIKSDNIYCGSIGKYCYNGSNVNSNPVGKYLLQVNKIKTLDQCQRG